MKLFKNYFAILALVALAFTSCSSPDDVELTDIEQFANSPWTLTAATEQSGTDVLSAAGTQVLTFTATTATDDNPATATNYTVSGVATGGPRPNYGDNGNAGTWALSGSTATFTPTDGTASTASYVLTDSDENGIDDQLVLEFTSSKNSTTYIFTYTR